MNGSSSGELTLSVIISGVEAASTSGVNPRAAAMSVRAESFCQLCALIFSGLYTDATSTLPCSASESAYRPSTSLKDSSTISSPLVQSAFSSEDSSVPGL